MAVSAHGIKVTAEQSCSLQAVSYLPVLGGSCVIRRARLPRPHAATSMQTNLFSSYDFNRGVGDDCEVRARAADAGDAVRPGAVADARRRSAMCFASAWGPFSIA